MKTKFSIVLVAAFLCGLFLSCGVAEAGTLPVATAQIVAIKPMVNAIGWMLLFVATIFM
jgi:hypothetical protein